jgi:hypothetical protein
MELAGVARVRDPTLVRHIYDLHVTSAYYDATEVAELAREIMPHDAEEFEPIPAAAANRGPGLWDLGRRAKWNGR